MFIMSICIIITIDSVHVNPSNEYIYMLIDVAMIICVINRWIIQCIFYYDLTYDYLLMTYCELLTIDLTNDVR